MKNKNSWDVCQFWTIYLFFLSFCSLFSRNIFLSNFFFLKPCCISLILISPFRLLIFPHHFFSILVIHSFFFLSGTVSVYLYYWILCYSIPAISPTHTFSSSISFLYFSLLQLNYTAQDWVLVPVSVSVLYKFQRFYLVLYCPPCPRTSPFPHSRAMWLHHYFIFYPISYSHDAYGKFPHEVADKCWHRLRNVLYNCSSTNTIHMTLPLRESCSYDWL